jgi:glycogen debranching enzyme|tara:strand:- start:1101 stop:2378 length:1278 start_codon:yes stop_codon:yes gene_type:complete
MTTVINEHSLSLKQRAQSILKANDQGGYTVPTKGLYPYQWNWDSVLAAWGFASFDVDRAWQELESLFGGQWENGMVPHIIFHKPDDSYFPGPAVWGADRSPATTGITQPPIAATFARKIYDEDRKLGLSRAQALYTPLLRWHRWFMTYRVEENAIVITHPWESGRDNAVDWDLPARQVDVSQVGEYTRRDTSHVNSDMRPKKADYDRYIALVNLGRNTGWDEKKIRDISPFRVADPGMTFILLRACRDLLWLCEELNDDANADKDEIEGWISTLEAGAQRLWNPAISAYDSLDIRTGKYAGSLSNASYLCWYAGIQSSAMLEHLNRVYQQLPYPVPSLDPGHPDFDPLRYWRGPVWPFFNALIGIGLEDAGQTDEALHLKNATNKLIAKEGFFEYCHPQSAQGAGGDNFTWTAAIWLSWIDRGMN